MDKGWSLHTAGGTPETGDSRAGAQTAAPALGRAPAPSSPPPQHPGSTETLGSCHVQNLHPEKVLASRKGLKITLEGPGSIPPGAGTHGGAHGAWSGVTLRCLTSLGSGSNWTEVAWLRHSEFQRKGKGLCPGTSSRACNMVSGAEGSFLPGLGLMGLPPLKGKLPGKR